MTQLLKAKRNEVTKEIKIIASKEEISTDILMENVAQGFTVIPANRKHKNLNPIGIGRGLRIKVNANIGASTDKFNLGRELKKLDVALKAGADAIMDLTILPKQKSTDEIREAIIENCDVPIGTVPIYQAVIESGGPENLSLEGFLETFEKHARQGVDFATIHAGVTRDAIPLVNNRLMAVVSRGGSFLPHWMK